MMEEQQKPIVTSTSHPIDFGAIPSDRFEALCFDIVSEEGHYDDVEHYGMTGDKKRDVIGYKRNKAGDEEQCYFQCKRYDYISASILNKELDAIKAHVDVDPRFKPKVIYFVTACEVSASCKDNVKTYAKSLKLGHVHFWDVTELDYKVRKFPSIYKHYFRGGVDETEIAESVVSLLIPKLKMDLAAFTSTYKKQEVSGKIDKGLVLMTTGNIEEAKETFMTILGEIGTKTTENAEELTRIYNNLGVCYQRSNNDNKDLDKAEKYFTSALEINPNFEKAKINLATVFIGKEGEKNYEKAYEILWQLWNGKGEKNIQLLQALIWVISLKTSSEEAVKFYDNSTEAQEIGAENEDIQNVLGLIYLELEEFDKADNCAKLILESSPNSAHGLLLKARTLLARTQKEKIIPSEFDVVPRFHDYKQIEEAAKTLDDALEAVKSDGNKLLEAQIKRDILICHVWLKRAQNARYRDIRKSIDETFLKPEDKRLLEINDFAENFEARNFEIAYNFLINSQGWPQNTFEEKLRLASAFFMEGAVEQAKDILKQLEQDAEKEVGYWLRLSLAEVLLNNRTLAISAIQKARELSKGTDTEKSVLSNFNSLMQRYASSGETDRLVEGMFDFHKKYPEDKMVRTVRAIEENGKLAEEFGKMLSEQKKWYENLRKTFRSQPAPSYVLERALRRPYAEILSFRNDPEFMIEMTFSGKEIEDKLIDNLLSAEGLVFDYASLLNLSKMNILGHLEKLKKPLYIAHGLFRKIQEELCMFENEDLRRLWNFVRSSKKIHIVDDKISSLKDDSLTEIFDEWIISSIQVAKDKKALFMTDDLCLARLLETESIKTSNTLMVLKEMRTNNWIDKKIYSTGIGDLAERFYTFLPITGDDLFQIAMEDQGKITNRSIHLVNHIFLPGSIASSFTGVFLRFIDLLWKTGSLPEDKMNWLNFLTQTILEFLKKQGGTHTLEELKKIAPHFASMWITAIKNSNLDELNLIEKKSQELPQEQFLKTFKENLIEHISKKRAELSK